MMNTKNKSIFFVLLIVTALIDPCFGQGRHRGHRRDHHHHDDGYRRGGGVLSGLGTVLGIAGAGLLASAVTRGITGGRRYPMPVYPPVGAYPSAGLGYRPGGYQNPYIGGGYADPYGDTYYGGGGVYSPYSGGYPGGVRRRVTTTVSDSVYPSTIY